MVYFQKMTPEGYKQIEDEIARLKKGRPRRIKILQAARALGDLSENTEYTEAKRYLGKQLKYTEIVETKDDGKVDLGKIVVLKFDDDEDTEEYKIVGRMEADLADGKISFGSPLGQAIMKKRQGRLQQLKHRPENIR